MLQIRITHRELAEFSTDQLEVILTTHGQHVCLYIACGGFEQQWLGKVNRKTSRDSSGWHSCGSSSFVIAINARIPRPAFGGERNILEGAQEEERKPKTNMNDRSLANLMKRRTGTS